MKYLNFFIVFVSGYDGGRKRIYNARDMNFIRIFDKIDSMKLRQREMMLQKEKQIECKNRL